MDTSAAPAGRPVHPAWLAGLLEGEGSFGVDAGRPVVEVKMTDRDVIARAAHAFGDVSVYAVPQTAEDIAAGYKQAWRARVRGGTAIAVMLRVLPHMGERRSARIAGIVANYYAARAPHGPGRAPTCQASRLNILTPKDAA